MAAECDSSAKRRLFAGSTLKKFCEVKIAVKGRLSLKVVASFVGRSSHTIEQ